MTAFLVAAAILVAVTLLLLLPALLRRGVSATEASRTAINAGIYRDELEELESDFSSGSLDRKDYEESRRELQRRLLEDAGGDGAGAARALPARKSALLIGLALPLAGALLYFTLGNVAALAPQPPKAPQVTAQDIEDMVSRLAARLEQNPQDSQGWLMLGRSYKALGRYPESVRAYEKAEDVVKGDAHLLAEQAEAIGLNAGGSLRGRPSELLERALKLDPEAPNVLVLAGSAAYEREDFATAVTLWERLLKQLPPDSEDAQSIAEGIRQARAKIGEKKKP